MRYKADDDCGRCKLSETMKQADLWGAKRLPSSTNVIVEVITMLKESDAEI